MDESSELEAAERVVMWWDSSSASTAAIGRDNELMLFDGTGDRAKAQCFLRAPFFIFLKKPQADTLLFLKNTSHSLFDIESD
jgi:hypothetical protein